MRAALLLVAALAGAAHAGPTARLGMTIALADQSAPLQNQVGPMIGVGIPFGRFVAEADYALLSFMEPDVVGGGGMHRFGVNLRADLLRRTNHCFIHFGCAAGIGAYAEIGAAVRYGQWHIDANTQSPSGANRQREVHLGFGLELDNRILPTRLGWQFGIRLAAASRDDVMFACRGTGCPAGVRDGGALDLAVLVEWMFILGR
jgi:hypothetical protein